MSAAQNRRYAPEVVWDPDIKAYLQSAFGNEKFHAISSALCQPPRNTCVRVNTLRATPQAVLEAVKAHAQELQAAPGAAASDSPSEPPQPAVLPPPFIHPDVPIAVMLPGVGPLPVDYSITGGKEVVVSRKAGEAMLRGAPVYAPGVLACSPGVSQGDLVAVSVAVEPAGSTWCGITRGTTLAPNHTVPHANAQGSARDRSALHVGVARTHMSRAEMFRSEQGTVLVLEQPVFRVPPAPEGLAGCIMLQNLPSVVAALALSPPPGSSVLDMCAAPGGKSTLIAQLMGGSGCVTALDRTHAKAAEIMALAAELGLTNVRAHRMDASKCVLEPGAQPEGGSAAASEGQQGPGEANEVAPQRPVGEDGMTKAERRAARKRAAAAARGATATRLKSPQLATRTQRVPGCEEGDKEQGDEAEQEARPESSVVAYPFPPIPAPPGFAPESFDCVLLDAPCSALGLRPRLAQTANLNYLRQCGVYTRRLLDAAVRLVKPGGRLVFSTCTISPWENEVSVRYALDRYGAHLQLVPALPRVGGPGLTAAHPTGGLAVAGANGGPSKKQKKAAEAAAAGANPQQEDGTTGTGASASAGVIAAAAGGAELQGPSASTPHMAAGTGAAVQLSRGREGVDGQEVWLSETEALMVQRFDPSGPQDSIGFFVAAFKKTSSMYPAAS